MIYILTAVTTTVASVTENSLTIFSNTMFVIEQLSLIISATSLNDLARDRCGRSSGRIILMYDMRCSNEGIAALIKGEALKIIVPKLET